MRAAVATSVLLILCAGGPAAAQQDSDLSLIPPAAMQSEHAARAIAPATKRHFVENALTASPRWNSGLSAVPENDISDRLSFDALDSWPLSASLSVTLSDRFNLLGDNRVPWTIDSGARNDLRELFVSWRPTSRTFVNVGRINLREGLGQGYSSTDYFKSGSRVDLASIDPTAARANRLGSAMIELERLWTGGAFRLAVSPKLARVDLNRVSSPLDLRLNRTNTSNRVLLAVTAEFADLSPQMTLLFKDSRWTYGISASHLVGQSLMLRADWSGGRQLNLIGRAFQTERSTRVVVLPAIAGLMPERSFFSDLVLGGTWSDSLLAMTMTIEYHFHAGGFSEKNWATWFTAVGRAADAEEAQLIRNYASYAQEPLGRHEAYVHLTFNDLYVLNLDASLLAITSLRDGSTLGQLSVTYDLSSQWSLGFYAGFSVGARKSEYGSFGDTSTVAVVVDRYL